MRRFSSLVVGTLGNWSCMSLLLLGLALFFASTPSFALPTASSWKPLGAHWVVHLDARGEASEILDLSDPGILGHAILGRVTPRSKPAGQAITKDQSQDWWREIPWKDKNALALTEPKSFALSEIDFTRAIRDPERFEGIVEEWNRGIFPDFLKQFRFVRGASGEYEIHWQQTQPLDHPLPLGLPKALVVLKPIKTNLWRALGHQALETALGEATSLVTIPVVSALFGTAVDRFFHSADLLNRTRLEALAELLTDPPASFDGQVDSLLGPALREKAAEGVLYAQTTLYSGIRWLWRKPARQWRTRLLKEKRATTSSRLGLERAGLATSPLSDSLDWEPASGRFYLSGAGLIAGHSSRVPELGLDPSHPDGILERRLGVEISTLAVVFAGHWVPIAGSVGVALFKSLVESPEDNRRLWEARLSARLEEREAQLGENWEPELTRLALQRASPFELDRERSLRLVARRRTELGLN